MIDFVKKFLPFFLIFLIIIVNGFRLFQLDKVPLGYNIDEYSTAVTVRCFALEGLNCWGEKAGLFLHVGYGTPRPPTYMWPVALWAKVFGTTVPSLRAFTALGVIFGIVGIFFLGRRVGGLTCGLWSALAASLSPIVFVCSRLGLESIFGAVFFGWGLFFLLKAQSKVNMGASAAFIGLSLYSYPPERLFIPLFLMVFFVLCRGWRYGFLPWVVFFLVLVLITLPLILGIVSGELQTRFNQISIFGQAQGEALSPLWMKNVWSLFINNLGLHLSWEFLFRKGGLLVHSTGRNGLFSWLDYAGWGFGLFLLLWRRWYKKDRGAFQGQEGIILLCIAGFFLSLIPASLTNHDIPNALRTSVHWPVVSLLTGVLISQAEKWWPWLAAVALAVAVLFSVDFLYDFFKKYPDRSKGMFEFWVLKHAQQLKTTQDWNQFLVRYRMKDFHTRYYLMKDRGLSCGESFEVWKFIYNMMGKGRGY
ncbi:MAG TPA: glycosyltransferase family 39 protein [Candidatus Omnitrophota bacterium]|nr:glycosyltransferase family 39 protein [Candidatus Omnitrophota bacterium]